MGSKDFQRSIRTTRNVRSEGDAPDIGRVSRMPGTGIPSSGRRRRRRSFRAHKDDRRKVKVLKSWLMVLSVVAMIMLVVTIVAAVRSQQQKARRVDTAVGGSVAVVEKRIRSEFPSPSTDEALEMVGKAVAARDPQSVLELFRLTTTTPEEAVQQLKSIAERHGGVESMQWLSSIDANGILIDAVLVIYEQGGRAAQRLAMLTPDEKGVWKVDFDAFARTMEPSWERMVEPGVERAVVRAILAKDSYFNGPFRDESEWMCYGLASPDSPEIRLGYCRKDTPQARALKRILREDTLADDPDALRTTRATLQLRRVDGAEPRQFVIERVMAEDWVVVEPWFDERFE